MRKVLLILVLLSGNLIFAQTYNDYAWEFFFNLEPSASAEAMGRGSVASVDNAAAQYYNPALVSTQKGINITLSNSSPVYTLTEAQNYYAGINFKLNKKNSVGVSFKHFDSGEKIKFLEKNIEYQNNYPYTRSIFTATYSLELFNDISFGTNLNYFTQTLSANIPYEEVEDQSFNTFLIDIGAIKKFIISEVGDQSHQIYLSSTVKNLLNTKLKLMQVEEVLPSIFSIGSAYKFALKDENTKIVEVYIDLEYRDLLNSKYRTTYRFGSEVSLYEIVKLRVGYFSQNKQSFAQNSKSSVESFTYGIGLNLPLNKVFNLNLPMNLSINFASFKQPTHITDFDDWDNLTSFDVNLNFML